MPFITGSPWLPKGPKLINLKSSKAPEDWVDPPNITSIPNMQNQSKQIRPGPSWPHHPMAERPPSQGERPGLASAAAPGIYLNSLQHCILSKLNPLKH